MNKSIIYSRSHHIIRRTQYSCVSRSDPRVICLWKSSAVWTASKTSKGTTCSVGTRRPLLTSGRTSFMCATCSPRSKTRRTNCDRGDTGKNLRLATWSAIHLFDILRSTVSVQISFDLCESIRKSLHATCYSYAIWAPSPTKWRAILWRSDAPSDPMNVAGGPIPLRLFFQAICPKPLVDQLV